MAAVDLNRQQIRRSILLRTGFATDEDDLANAQITQVNEFILQASEWVASKFDWAQHRVDAKVNTTEGTEDYLYPALDTDNNPIRVTPEGVWEVALWEEDSKRYLPLKRTRILQEWRPDYDIMTTEELQAVLERPCYYEPTHKFRLNPVPDKEYVLRLTVTPDPRLIEDEDVSVFDGEAVIQYGVYLLQRHLGRGDLAQQALLDANQRVNTIARRQSPDVPLAMGGRDRRLRDPYTYDRTDLNRREWLWGREPFSPST